MEDRFEAFGGSREDVVDRNWYWRLDLLVGKSDGRRQGCAAYKQRRVRPASARAPARMHALDGTPARPKGSNRGFIMMLLVVMVVVVLLSVGLPSLLPHTKERK